MKTKNDMSVSQIFNRMENLNISSGRTLENNNRPISAAVKRPDSKAKINNSNFINITPIVNKVGVSSNLRNINFGSIVTDINTKRNNYSSNKTRVNSINLEKERLYEDTIHLKNRINEMKKEISNLKSENHKYNSEVNKKDKIIEEILIDSQNNMFNNNPLNESKVLSKAKETHLFIQTKKHFKELKNDYKTKCLELESVKKNLKITKINEIAIELNIYKDELARIKSLYFVTSQQNEINEKKLKDFDEIHHNYIKQQYVILTMQDKINMDQLELKTKNEEIYNLKNQNLEKSNKNKKLTAEIKIIDEINHKISKDKKTVNDINALKTKLDKQIGDLNKEISYYKDLSEKKDRRLRDLESSLKAFSDNKNNYNGNTFKFNIESIRNIQDNPEDKTDKTLLYLRSKLMEANSKNETLHKRTGILEEKLKQYENQYQVEDNCIKIF
jgi:chromosome segregation ATPase